jgi:hypothetical protein
MNSFTLDILVLILAKGTRPTKLNLLKGLLMSSYGSETWILGCDPKIPNGHF